MIACSDRSHDSSADVRLLEQPRAGHLVINQVYGAGGIFVELFSPTQESLPIDNLSLQAAGPKDAFRVVVNFHDLIDSPMVSLGEYVVVALKDNRRPSSDGGSDIANTADASDTANLDKELSTAPDAPDIEILTPLAGKVALVQGGEALTCGTDENRCDELIERERALEARIPPDVASRILCDALAGLHAAHEALDVDGRPLHVVHRDVSPHNIIVGVDGTSRLIDFGIAKAAARLSSTASGNMKGKLSYMSPEQVQQKALDRCADVFAADITWFETLTGLRLFGGDSQADVALNVLIGEIPTLADKGIHLGPDGEDTLAKALTRDRDERFQTAEAFRQALEHAVPPASHPRVATRK